MLPFTHEQFLAVFAAYNRAVWPAPLAAYLAGAAVCLAAGTGRPGASRAVPLGLAAMWLWTGIAYHWMFFSRVNAAALAFGAAFVAQGLLLVLAAARRRLEFSRARPSRVHALGWGLAAYAALAYPAVGALAGVHFPAAPVFGITPCPVTLFTLGVLLLARSVPWWLLPVPLAWSLVGGSAALLLGMPQDWPLLLSPLAALPLLWRMRRQAQAA